MSLNRCTSYTVMENVTPKYYYYFEQRNVEGVMLFDKELKISNNVIVRATTEKEALEKLFDVTSQIATPHLNICQCCGERWTLVDKEFFLQNIVISIEQKSECDKIFIHE